MQLPTQNYLVMKKKLFSPVVFAVSPTPEFCFIWMDRQKDRQTMSNTIIADWLLAPGATNNSLLVF